MEKEQKTQAEEKKQAEEKGPAEAAQPQPGEPVTLSADEYRALTENACKAQENWDKYIRLHADIENTRKRWERERQELFRFANEGLLSDLLNINDDLERSLSLSQDKHEDFTAFMKGVEMIAAHLHDLLKKNGIKPMEAAGKQFDPNFHEALMQGESGDVPENTVMEELQKGYLIDGRVLRTAKVKVSKKPVTGK